MRRSFLGLSAIALLADIGRSAAQSAVVAEPPQPITPAVALQNLNLSEHKARLMIGAPPATNQTRRKGENRTQHRARMHGKR